MATKNINYTALSDNVWTTWKEVLLNVSCIYKTNEKERRKAKHWNIAISVMFFIDAILAGIGALGYSAISWVSVALTSLTAIMNLLDRLSSVFHVTESELHISEELATELSMIAGNLDNLFNHLYQKEWKSEYSKDFEAIKNRIAALDVKCDRAIHDLTDCEIAEINERIDNQITHKYVNYGE